MSLLMMFALDYGLGTEDAIAIFIVGIASGVYAYLLWAARHLPCETIEVMFPDDRRQMSDIGEAVEASSESASRPHAA